jgi:hypothetical protein
MAGVNTGYYHLDGGCDYEKFVIIGMGWGWYGFSRVTISGQNFGMEWHNTSSYPTETDHVPRVSTDGDYFALAGSYPGLYYAIDGTMKSSFQLDFGVPGIDEHGTLIIGKCGSVVQLYNSSGGKEWNTTGSIADISDDGNYIVVVNGTTLDMLYKIYFYQIHKKSIAPANT